MFGKRKQEELIGIIRDFKNKIDYSYKHLHDNLKETINKLTVVHAGVEKVKKHNEDNKRDISYINIISGEIKNKLDNEYNTLKDICDHNTQVTEQLKLVKTKIADETVISELIKTKSLSEEVKSELEEIRELAQSLKEILSHTSALSLNAAIKGAKFDDGTEGFVQTATDIKDLATEGSKIIGEFNRTIEKIEDLSLKKDLKIDDANEIIKVNNSKIQMVENDLEQVTGYVSEGNERIVKIKEEFTNTVNDLNDLTRATEELNEKQDDIYLDTKELEETLNEHEELLSALSDKLNDIKNITNKSE